MHPRSRHWHLIDYIITRQRDLPDFLDTRAMRGANCSTDHVMIKSTTRLRVRQIKKKGKLPTKKLDTSRIKIKSVREDLGASLTERLTVVVPGPVEDKWNSFKSIVYEVSREKLGTIKRKHEDWFAENSTELGDLIDNRNLARSNMLGRITRISRARYKACCQLLQRRCR